jgi:hypothetical protein
MAAVIERRLFTRQEYHTMVQAGILTEDDPVELLDGEIVRQMPSGPSHAGCINRLTKLLSARAGDLAIVTVQNPLALDEHSEPEPDVMLLRPRAAFYAESHPTSADVLLAIEVADTSLDADREVKVPLYAEHGLREVWLVDLPGRRVIVFRHPVGGRYTEERAYRAEDSIPLAALPGQQVRVSELGV